MIEKEVCPQIWKSQVWLQISSTVLSVIYHDQMDIMEQAASNILTTIFSFNEAFWPELASPWGDHHSKSLKEDQLTRGLRPWALALTSKSRLLPVSSLWVTRNLVLLKHPGRSAVTFVDFSLQSKFNLFKHEHWYRAKSKLHWNRPKNRQDMFCSREPVVVGSSPLSVPETAKKPFFLKSHSKRWLFLTLPVKRQATWAWY